MSVCFSLPFPGGEVSECLTFVPRKRDFSEKRFLKGNSNEQITKREGKIQLELIVMWHDLFHGTRKYSSSDNHNRIFNTLTLFLTFDKLFYFFSSLSNQCFNSALLVSCGWLPRGKFFLWIEVKWTNSTFLFSFHSSLPPSSFPHGDLSLLSFCSWADRNELYRPTKAEPNQIKYHTLFTCMRSWQPSLCIESFNSRKTKNQSRLISRNFLPLVIGSDPGQTSKVGKKEGGRLEWKENKKED